MNKLLDRVLAYPTVHKQIGKSDNPKKAQVKVEKCLNEIAANFSKSSIKMFEKLLDASLNKLYDDINFDEGDVDFKNLVKNNSVVLVPNHQSHADYIAINYAVFKKFGFPLYVAGGDNLNIFPLGSIFRKSGCFFIRRSFQNDIIYRLTLEAYLSTLLEDQLPIEFFFEGGRSRTGKLRPPKYGLYKMLLNSYYLNKSKSRKPLVFLPVSIVHEYVPETKALANELLGGKKKKESAKDILSLLKLFARKFGNINIRLGNPITVGEFNEETIRDFTRDLAFNCYREVGKNMILTPSSLLSMILLEEPTGALSWHDIVAKAETILEFCKKFNIPLSIKLYEQELEKILGTTVDLFIGNGKIDVLGKQEKSLLYYTIKNEARSEMLYFKNTILHHFILPYIINLGWVRIFRGEIENFDQLRRFFLDQRKQLKHEFYLPTVENFLKKAALILSDALGREITDFKGMFELNSKDTYAIISKVGIFGRSLSYIHEAYLISALTLKAELQNDGDFITKNEYLSDAKEMFNERLRLGRIIRYRESLSLQLFESALKYFVDINIISNEDNSIKLINIEKLNICINDFKKDLKDQLMINIRN